MVRVMDSAELRKLSRAEIQSVAKRELVRAVGKTEVIIRRLLRKYPKGVPVPEDSRSTSRSPVRRDLSKEPSKSKSIVVDQPQKATREVQGKAGHAAIEPLNVPGEIKIGSSPSNPREIHDDTQQDSATAPDQNSRVKTGPDEDMVVDALREFTGLVNSAPAMRKRMRETQTLLDRTESLIEGMMPNIRETSYVREKLEVVLLAKMKKKPELWDGTAQLGKQDRKLRMEWLRSERKAESISKWNEDNETFLRNGHSPEPYEHYASESEGEIIESLQTTPQSSRNGSPRRPTEEQSDSNGSYCQTKRCQSED